MAGKRGAGKGDLPPPLAAEPQLRGQHQVRGRQHGGDDLCCHSQHKVCRVRNFASIRELSCRIGKQMLSLKVCHFPFHFSDQIFAFFTVAKSFKTSLTKLVLHNKVFSVAT
jgi:hypothetical protein